jgi:hypothetical protein
MELNIGVIMEPTVWDAIGSTTKDTKEAIMNAAKINAKVQVSINETTQIIVAMVFITKRIEVVDAFIIASTAIVTEIAVETDIRSIVYVVVTKLEAIDTDFAVMTKINASDSNTVSNEANATWVINFITILAAMEEAYIFNSIVKDCLATNFQVRDYG